MDLQKERIKERRAPSIVCDDSAIEDTSMSDAPPEEPEAQKGLATRVVTGTPAPGSEDQSYSTASYPSAAEAGSGKRCWGPRHLRVP